LGRDIYFLTKKAIAYAMAFFVKLMD